MPLLLVLGLMGMAARQGFRPIGDPDTWWHLRLGDDIWRTWNFTDPAPWTRFATEHWVTTQWLPEVVASRFEHLFGLPGAVWLWCAGLVLITEVLYLVCRREADALAAAVATLVAILGMSATLTPRPQLVSFILLPIVTSAWLRTDRDLRPRWWLIPVSWLWARFLETTGSSYALVQEGSPLATALDERLHWRPLGRDDGYVLLAAPQ